ncbi:MAG: metal ABC transporter substrate-binding protein, partial [Ruminococcus sp.]
EESEDEPEYDEHVWLSVKNAKVLCEYIAEQLGKIDSADKNTFKSNTAAYTAQLDALDKDYQAAVDRAAVKTLLFGDRFPFRYLVDDYGLDYYAAFVGCSAESEASFETIVFLANKVDELHLKAICKIESSDGKIAQTIKDNTKEKNQEIVTFDSMQSTTGNQAKGGTTYLSVMKNNLESLKNALQ